MVTALMGAGEPVPETIRGRVARRGFPAAVIRGVRVGVKLWWGADAV